MNGFPEEKGYWFERNEEDTVRETPEVKLDLTDQEYVTVEVYFEDKYVEFRKHNGDPTIDLVKVNGSIEMEVLEFLHNYVKGAFE